MTVHGESCPRCGGIGTFESARRHPRKNRGVRVKCDCTFDEFGRPRHPETAGEAS